MFTFGGRIKQPWLPKVKSRTSKPRPRQLWKQWLCCCRQSTNKCSPSGPSPPLLTAIKRGPAGPNLLQGREATAVGSISTAGYSKNGERNTDEDTNRCTGMIILHKIKVRAWILKTKMVSLTSWLLFNQNSAGAQSERFPMKINDVFDDYIICSKNKHAASWSGTKN